MDATNPITNPAGHSAINLAVLRGTVSSEPRERELPSGASVTQLEVTTRTETATSSVPVVVHDRPVEIGAGDEIVVIGHVHRRFFRVGGQTQSRTEVVAARVLRTSRRRTVERALAAAARAIVPEPGPGR
jgi:single-strand DNA-binding protein